MNSPVSAFSIILTAIAQQWMRGPFPFARMRVPRRPEQFRIRHEFDSPRVIARSNLYRDDMRESRSNLPYKEDLGDPSGGRERRCQSRDRPVRRPGEEDVGERFNAAGLGCERHASPFGATRRKRFRGGRIRFFQAATFRARDDEFGKPVPGQAKEIVGMEGREFHDATGAG